MENEDYAKVAATVKIVGTNEYRSLVVESDDHDHD